MDRMEQAQNTVQALVDRGMPLHLAVKVEPHLYALRDVTFPLDEDAYQKVMFDLLATGNANLIIGTLEAMFWFTVIKLNEFIAHTMEVCGPETFGRLMTRLEESAAADEAAFAEGRTKDEQEPGSGA